MVQRACPASAPCASSARFNSGGQPNRPCPYYPTVTCLARVQRPPVCGAASALPLRSRRPFSLWLAVARSAYSLRAAHHTTPGYAELPCTKTSLAPVPRASTVCSTRDRRPAKQRVVTSRAFEHVGTRPRTGCRNSAPGAARPTCSHHLSTSVWSPGFRPAANHAWERLHQPCAQRAIPRTRKALTQSRERPDEQTMSARPMSSLCASERRPSEHLALNRPCLRKNHEQPQRPAAARLVPRTASARLS